MSVTGAWDVRQEASADSGNGCKDEAVGHHYSATTEFGQRMLIDWVSDHSLF
jgi:hypothetical protein